MLSKEKIISDMLAVLTELQAIQEKCFHPTDLQLRIYNGLTNKLEVYFQILDEDVPEEYVEQIEMFITV